VLVSLPERIGDLTLLGIASGVGAILSMLAFRSESQYELTILYTLAGVAMSIDYPSIMAHIGKEFPHATGRVMALAGAVSGGAGFLVPPAMGYVGELTGSMVAGMMLPVAMLAALSVTAFAWRRRLRPR
jgi:fucose permease